MAEDAWREIVQGLVLGPARETSRQNPEGTAKLVWAFNLWIDTMPRGARPNPSDLEILWLAPLQKELIWAILATLCGSYMCALRTIRAIFEMLVQAAAPLSHGNIGERIEGLAFLDAEERSLVKSKLWTEASAWVHPYRGWFKHIEQDRMEVEALSWFHYAPKLFDVCLRQLMILCDFMLVLALEKGFVKPDKAKGYVEPLELRMSGRRLAC